MPKQELILKVLRFGIVGGVVMLVFTSLNYVFANFWGKQIGFLVSYPPAVALHYSLNRWWTFGSTRTDKSKQVGEYLLMVAVCFAIQWVVFTALVTWTNLASPIAAGIANATQMLITYLAMDRRIFASKTV